MNEIKKGPFFGFAKDMPKGFVKTFGGANTSPAVVEALLSYCGGTGFIGKSTVEDMFEDTAYVAEYPISDDSAILVTYRVTSGAVSAAIAAKGASSFSQFTVSKTANDARAIIFAMLPLFEESHHTTKGYFSEAFDEFKIALGEGADTSNDKLQSAASTLSAIIYERITALTDEIPVKMPSTGNFFVDDEIITENIVEEVLLGKPMFFQLGEGVTVPDAGPAVVIPAEEKKDYTGKFKLSETPDEYKQLIPSLPPYYVHTKEILTILKHIVATTGDVEPMRNFLLRGPSGTGKTVGSMAIANGLGKPYVSITCSANTEIIDLLGQMLPNVSGTDESFSLSDVTYAPDEVFQKLTGTEKEDATSEEVFNLLMEKKASSQYIYQESDFVRAIRNGWVVEIQEAAAITNPAVLTGLNKILNMAEMTAEGMLLPDNTRLKRHPESIVILTTNVNYEGCRPLNQSVLDRMSLIYDMEMPPRNDLLKRVKARTGFEDDDVLARMVRVIDQIEEQMRISGINGTCGPRALNDWVRSVMITGDPFESGVLAVVNKAATEREDRDVITKILESQFTPKGMRE